MKACPTNQMPNPMLISQSNLLLGWMMLMVRLCVAVRCCNTIALISKTIRWLFRLFFIYIIFLLSLSHPCSFSEKIYLLSSFVFVVVFFSFRILLSMCSNYGHFRFHRFECIERARERMRKMIWNVLRDALFQKMLIINYLLIIFWWHWYKFVCACVCLYVPHIFGIGCGCCGLLCIFTKRSIMLGM